MNVPCVQSPKNLIPELINCLAVAQNSPQEKLGPCFLGKQLRGSQNKIFVNECVWRHLLFPIILYIGLKRSRIIYMIADTAMYVHIHIFERRLQKRKNQLLFQNTNSFLICVNHGGKETANQLRVFLIFRNTVPLKTLSFVLCFPQRKETLVQVKVLKSLNYPPGLSSNLILAKHLLVIRYSQRLGAKFSFQLFC